MQLLTGNCPRVPSLLILLAQRINAALLQRKLLSHAFHRMLFLFQTSTTNIQVSYSDQTWLLEKSRRQPPLAASQCCLPGRNRVWARVRTTFAQQPRAFRLVVISSLAHSYGGKGCVQ